MAEYPARGGLWVIPGWLHYMLPSSDWLYIFLIAYKGGFVHVHRHRTPKMKCLRTGLILNFGW